MRFAAGVHQDIRRLEIAVHHALLMRVMYCFGDLHHQVRCFTECQSLRRKPFTEIRSLDEIAGDKDRIPVAADLVHADNTWMLQLGCSPSIAEEVLLIRRIKLPATRDLEGHNPVQGGVSCLVHGAKMPGPDLLQ